MKSYEYEYQYEQVKNERLREQLAQSDQLVEWLSKENAALKREAREVSVGLLELRDVTTEALSVMRKRVDHDAAEIEKLRGYVARDAAEVEKWRERYHSSASEIEGLNKLSGDLMRELDAAFARADILRVELATANKVKEEVAAHARKLEARVKGLTGRPGTISIGEGGVYILGFGTPSQEVLDAAESLRAEHFRNMEDEWYSCPKSGHCWNDLPDDLCTCGADDANVAVDLVLAYLRGEAT